jgi:murein DD-endopeptidase MepM/ murein hydrolase activator NlpD
MNLYDKSNKKFVPWHAMMNRNIRVALFVGLFVSLGCQNRETAFVATPSDVIVTTGTVGAGGSFSDILTRSGVVPNESVPIQKAIKSHINLRSIKPNDRYEVARSSVGHLYKLTYWSNDFEYVTVEPAVTGAFDAQAHQVPTNPEIVGASGKIQVSLWESMTSQGISPEMIYRFADIFGWRIDFLTEPRAGDTYKVVWRRARSDKALRDDEILCALYQGKETGLVYAFRLSDEYFDEKGDSLRGEFLRAPLAYRRISSRFTNARYHPVLRYYRPHHGIDYAAARGTPVVTIGDGTVIVKNYHGGLGNQVRVRHTGSYVSIYGHLMGFARGVRVGGSVKQGQVIGYVGSTGLSTGPHLHFGLERSGQLMNFLSLKSSLKRRSVPQAERENFRDTKKKSFSYFVQLNQPGSPIEVMR